MIVRIRTTVLRVLPSAAAVWVVALACVSVARADEPVAWELRPYQIQLLVAAADGAAPAPGRAEALGQSLAARVRTVVGGSWHLQAAAAPPELATQMLADIASVTAAELPADALKLDKVMLLAVTAGAGRTELVAREFDVATQAWNSTLRRRCEQPAALEHVAFGTLLAAFAPLARIERVEGGTVMIRLRAGSIPRRDATLPLVPSGTVFRPLLVAGPTPRDITPIAWTWLAPGKIDGPLVECQLESGLRPPAIPDYHPLRERLALGVTAVPEEVRLSIVSPATPPVGQSGLDIYAVPAEGAEQFLGRTDRQGQVRIPPADKPLRVLHVKQGENLLARLPLVTGLEREMTVNLSADPGRLAAERFLRATRDVLIDAAARRELLIGRIRNHIDRDEAVKARKLLAELKSLPTEERLVAEIDIEERRLWPKGKPAAGPLVAEFTELREQVKKRLARGPIEELDGELAE